MDADNLVGIKDHEPHFNYWVLCVAKNHGKPCLHRWVATCHWETPLFKLQCPRCERQSSFAVPIPQALEDLHMEWERRQKNGKT
jgi:hypothetical protein